MLLHEPPRVGTAVIAFTGRAVWLGKRKGSHEPGVYACPGGSLDKAKPDEKYAETPRQGARREFGEECGIWLPEDKFQPVPIWAYDRFEDAGKHFVTLYFAVKLSGAVQPKLIEPHKCEGWELHPSSALPTPLWDGTAEAIRVARKMVLH